MSAARHLPSGAEPIAYDQGWDDESLVIHLAGFIAKQGLETELTQYLADVAAEENAGSGSDAGTEEDETAPE
jgi:hypothetical protein